MIKDKKIIESTPSDEAVPARRSFLKKIFLPLGILVLAELVWITFSFLRPKKKDVNKDTSMELIEAGNVNSFEKESVTAFVQGQFYLSRLKDGKFLAVSRKCTHLGCALPWNEEKKQFICPCHASVFDITGDVISAPAQRALDLYEIYIENDIVMVNTGKRIKRSRFNEKQSVKS